ncbi:hypothetical protein U3516DRAFT_741535 [Neocallimastix sp. 'constans']
MSENCSKDENERIKMEDQTISKNIYFSNQTISNACGTMAIHHALLNNTKLVDIVRYLEQSKDLASVHSKYSVKGQTSVSEAENNSDGDLYELDGRKEFSINHGKCDDLLKGAVKIIREVIKRNPNSNEITAQCSNPYTYLGIPFIESLDLEPIISNQAVRFSENLTKVDLNTDLTSGYSFVIGITLSTTEAEYFSLIKCTKQVIWIERLKYFWTQALNTLPI